MPIVFFRHIWSTVSNIIFVTLAALAALSLFQSAFFHVNMAFMVHPTQLVGVTVHVYALFTKLKQKSAKIECCGMYSTTSCCLFPTHLGVATLITTEQLQKIFFFVCFVSIPAGSDCCLICQVRRVKPKPLPSPRSSAVPIPPRCGTRVPCKCWSWACRSCSAPPSVAADASCPWCSNRSPAARRARPGRWGTGRWGWRAGGWWSRPRSSRRGTGRPPAPAWRPGRGEWPLRARAARWGVACQWRWPWFPSVKEEERWNWMPGQCWELEF